MRCDPRFDYARATHTVERRSDTEILFVGRSGARELVLRLHLLPWFGAIAVDGRVVRDGPYIFTAGVTAGIDGALSLAADLRGRSVAEFIQLYIAYAPEPPFNSGTPETASPGVLEAARRAGEDLAARRLATAQRIHARLGIVDRVGQPPRVP
jgi:hypothetical protein